MARRPRHAPLRVLLNNRLVGRLSKAASGAIEFRYEVVGTNNHYRIAEVQGRHFLQTGEAAGVPKKLVQESIEMVAATAEAALGKTEGELPNRFPEAIHTSVKAAVIQRLHSLKVS
ncbi:hypothetical protein [Bradyrhizobium sp. BR 1432]|uniref:hypothetical protein n=1 Tax=Bradyrhizobium sp. BR 1432 TaxID=3447966 RepID=UPI003EE43B37